MTEVVELRMRLAVAAVENLVCLDWGLDSFDDCVGELTNFGNQR
jgi:hypothetical protein